MTTHPTAVIENGVDLGEDVTVEAHVMIYAGAKIGDGCHLGPGCVIHGGTTLGEGCRVHANVVIGDIPQDLSFAGGESYVVIGKRCVFRECVTVHRGTKEGSSTTIGDDCYFMNCSHVGHNVAVGNKVILVNGAVLAGYVEIGDGAFLSANIGIHQFCRVGRLAIMGGNSSASKDVPPFCILRPVVLGDMAGLNVVGLRRAGVSLEDRTALKAAYKRIFRGGISPRVASEALLAESDNPFVIELAAFVLSAKRGVCSHGGV